MDQGELVFADGRGFTIDARPGGHISMLSIFEPRPGQLRFVVPLPGAVPTAGLPELYQALARVNAQLSVGTFYLQEDRGAWAVLLAMVAYYNHDGTISDLVVDRCVNACRVTAEHFLKELVMPEQQGG